LAGAGIRGSDELDELPRAVVTPDVDAVVAACVFDASECPGATADTSAAIPAVSAAAAPITQRRVRTIRPSAASRASAAFDLRGPGLAIFEFIVGRENQRPVRAV
jgi:hypothetical protein